MTGLALVAQVLTAVAAALVVGLIVPPPRRLHDRVSPYLTPTLFGVSRSLPTGPLRSVFGPLVRDLAERLGRILDRAGSTVTLDRLRQAGWFRGMTEPEMIVAYRVLQLRSLAVWAGAGLAVGQVLGASTGIRLVLLALAAVVGATRTRGRLDRHVAERRELMKIEIYTVNQLLAMRVRAGGGVIQAVRGIVERGSGGVIGELEEALRLHRAGWAGPDAFRRIAELTPEPFCARTYRLLATAEERGADLAGALLSLSEDVRETRREMVKRVATKRRAAMLIPTVAILAPVLILFVAAPLPYLITSWQ
jgi:Flp pilus assembly protein TadB